MRILVLIMLVACGGGGSGGTPPDFGETCDVASDCLTEVCWDFSDYDPFCGGKVCSAECEVDQDCIDMAETAGAPAFESASCGADGLCSLVGTGLGSFACS